MQVACRFFWKFFWKFSVNAEEATGSSNECSEFDSLSMRSDTGDYRVKC